MDHLLKYGYPQKIVFKLIKNILSIYDGSFLILEYSHHLKHFRINLLCEKHGCDSPGHQNTLLFLFMEFLLCLYKRKKKVGSRQCGKCPRFISSSALSSVLWSPSEICYLPQKDDIMNSNWCIGIWIRDHYGLKL